MKFLILLLKLLMLLGTVGLMALPLILEHFSFRKDRKNKISHKRFRLLVFSVFYVIVLTIVFMVVRDLLGWIGSWSGLKWIGKKIFVPSRLTFGLSVYAAMLINFAIGMLLRLLQRLVRIGLKKKNLLEPKGKNGEFTWAQKAERAVLRYFHDEKWFFAGKILKFLCIFLSAAYAVLFICYQLPVLFGYSWLPYGFFSQLFSAGYIYPMITLVALWQAYYFLAGVELLEEECPELLGSIEETLGTPKTDLQTVNAECQKLFQDYFKHQLKQITVGPEPPTGDYHEITKQIARGVESDPRNGQILKEGYLQCIDTIVRNDINSVGDAKSATGVLVNGGFFTEFSMYFLRYVSAILARGDNVVFVCNDDMQIEEVYGYVEQAFSELYSLYHTEGPSVTANYDDPIWKFCKISGDHDSIERSRVDDCSILITDMKYLCSEDFDENHARFTNLIDTVVFVDALTTVNAFARQMSLFHASIKNVRDINALRAKNSSKKNKGGGAADGFRLRYTSKQIKYVCFDDSRTPGLDKVLKNLLSADFVSSDAMTYAPETIICCYNYEGKPNEQGIAICPQAAKTREELGVLINMADFSIAFGGRNVSVFADRKVPYSDFGESVAANANHGLLLRTNENLRMNAPYYNPKDYRVIVAFDTEDNLPAIVRRYASMTPQQPTLVMIFSRAYLLRDYYTDNIETLWKPEQLMRIPVEHSGRENAIHKILVRANVGGICESEIREILKDANLPDYAELLENGSMNEILRKILADCGIHQNNTLRLYDYFEYDRSRDFDKDGRFIPQERICIRKRGKLYDYINGKHLIRLISESGEMILPLPKDRMTQNYIAGQNMLYNGCIYTISRLDPAAGKMYIRHATGGRNNISYQYLQDREYHIVFSEDAEKIYAKNHIMPHSQDGMTINEVSVAVRRQPMEVITNGYTPLDHRTLSMNATGGCSYVSLIGDDHIDLYKQTYRKYGAVEDPVCPSETIMNSKVDMMASPKGAVVMSVKFKGEFGEDPRKISTLAATMLSETLRSMFPSVADSLAVCPVLSEPFTDEASTQILSRQPKVFCRNYTPDAKDIELLIIEDCVSDIGVISVLISSGDDVMKMLFEPIHRYLQWHGGQREKSSYLYYGKDEAPECFDFEGLKKFSSMLCDNGYEIHFVEMQDVVLSDVCDFCGKRIVKGTDDMSVLSDGRKMCRHCASALVSNNKNDLKAHLDRAKLFLESTYGITIGADYDVCFESTNRIINALQKNRKLLQRGTDVPYKSYTDGTKATVESDLPSINLAELLVRELTHLWQRKHIPGLEEELAEGHIALVSTQYLRFLNQKDLANGRISYYESTEQISGIGYRRLVRELSANPKFKNNPFRYLLEMSGVPEEEQIVTEVTVKLEETEFGKPYVPEKPDRKLDGAPEYFYYNRLPEPQKALYNEMYRSICAHEDCIENTGFTLQEASTVVDCVAYDHPELFWYRTITVSPSTISFVYGASAQESAAITAKIEASAAQFLEGITDQMSAYDVALRLHVRMINTVDYDTLSLNEEKAAGGPDVHSIDKLRSIYGAFIEGKAVCEGYARAMQYLLQKCGIECAEAAGMICDGRQNAGGHAWIIIKIDGDYYYLDTTWDDSSDTVQTVKNDNLGFDFFMITTKELLRSRDLSYCPIAPPECTATRANYHYHNDLVLEKYDLNKIKQIAVTAAKNKAKFFTVKCTNDTVYRQTRDRLCADGTDCFEALRAAAKENKQLAISYRFSHRDGLRTIAIYFQNKE